MLIQPSEDLFICDRRGKKLDDRWESTIRKDQSINQSVNQLIKSALNTGPVYVPASFSQPAGGRQAREVWGKLKKWLPLVENIPYTRKQHRKHLMTVADM